MFKQITIWLLIKRIDFHMWWSDKLPRAIAWKLPKRVAYWATVGNIVKAAGRDTDPMSLTADLILKRTDPDNR